MNYIRIYQCICYFQAANIKITECPNISSQGKLLLTTLCLSPRWFWLCLAVVVSCSFVVEFRNRKYIAHWLALLAFYFKHAASCYICLKKKANKWWWWWWCWWMLKIYPVYLSFKNWNSRFFGWILLIALYVPLRQFNLLAFPYDYNIWLHESKREDNNSVNDIKK